MASLLPAQCDRFTLLPPELVAQVLANLPPEDAVRCSSVSWRWRSVVLQSSPYWRRVCARLGICREPSITWGDLAVAGMRLRNKLTHVTGSDVILVKKIGGPLFEKCSTTWAANPSGAGVFVVHVKSSKAATRFSNFVSIQSFTLEDRLEEETRVEVSPSFKLLQCFASRDYITLWGTNGEGVQYSRHSIAGSGSGTRRWEGAAVSPDLFEFSGCSSCPLVGLIGRSLSLDSDSWRLQLIRVHPAPSSEVERVECPFELRGELTGNGYCCVRKLCLIQNGSEMNGPFCASHKVLLQVGQNILVLRVKVQPGLSPSIEQLALLQPSSDLVHFADPAAGVVTLSSDHRLAGLADHHLCCWDLDSLGLTSRAKLSFIDRLQQVPRLLALGLQLSILCSFHELTVVCTTTGEALFRLDNSDTFAAVLLSPPLEQGWLNSVDCTGRRLELGICLYTWYKLRFSSYIFT